MHHATLGTMISLAHSINYCNSHRYTPTIVKPEEGKGEGEGKGKGGRASICGHLTFDTPTLGNLNCSNVRKLP